MKKNRRQLKKEKRNLRSKMKLKNKNIKNVCPQSKGKVLGKVQCPWDERRRKVLRPTYERLESFLKEVGNKSPFEYSQEMKLRDDRHKESSGYLDFMWEEVLGYVKNTQKTGQGTFINDDVFDWFIQLEHLITNNEMFWTLLPKIWLYRSHIITNGNEDIFNRYGRMNVPWLKTHSSQFEKRMECVDYLNIQGGKTILNEGVMTRDFMMKNYEKMDDEITLYRSFKCEKGKSIRKGVYKNNNHQSHIQEQGRGWSYSLNKSNSIFVNGTLNTHYYKKYLGLDDKKSKIQLQKNRNLTHYQMNNDPTLYEGFYDCIGIYKVKKKDIMFMTDVMMEVEVVVNPENVIFEDYKFLNITDLITQSIVLGLIHQGLGLDRSSIHNIDGVYSVFHKIIKKNLKHHPEVIKEVLTNKPLSSSKIINDWFEKYLEGNFGFKRGCSFVFDMFGHDSGMKNFGMLGVCDDSREVKMFSNNVNSMIQFPPTTSFIV